jgi:sugar lactone lactonase YvrE
MGRYCNVTLKTCFVCLAIAVLSIPSHGFTTELITLYGSGQAAFKNGTGKLAAFNQPFGICLDKDGNLYVADSGNLCIRRVSPSGVVSTFAGNGEKATVDGPAALARFNTPSGVRCDGQGNLYVCSYEENSIRVVAADGSVRSLVKNRTEGYRDGSLADARIQGPRGIVFDSRGNLLFSDCWNHRIRKITPDGVVSTVAGGGQTGEDAKATWADGQGDAARFFAPCGMAVDAQDNLYVADAVNHRIRKVTPGGMVTTIAGSGPSGKTAGGFADGPAAQSRLNTPTDLAIATDGTVYFADTYGNRIRKISPSGVVSTVAGTGEAGMKDGPAEKAQLNWPRGIVSQRGKLFFTDFNNNQVRTILLDSRQ